MNGIDLFGIAASYGLGCLATGYYLVRWKTGQDIRQLGSGSIGARNVGRILGRWGFGFTLAGDMLKGALAIWISRQLGASPTAVRLSLPAVVAGHLFPIQLRFHGGKGIAVSLGALLVLDFPLAIGWMLAFVVLFGCLHRYMLSGLISVCLIPVMAASFGRPTVLCIILILTAALILFAHRKHIADLLKRRIPPTAEDRLQGDTHP